MARQTSHTITNHKITIHKITGDAKGKKPKMVGRAHYRFRSGPKKARFPKVR